MTPLAIRNEHLRINFTITNDTNKRIIGIRAELTETMNLVSPDSNSTVSNIRAVTTVEKLFVDCIIRGQEISDVIEVFIPQDIPSVVRGQLFQRLYCVSFNIFIFLRFYTY